MARHLFFSLILLLSFTCTRQVTITAAASGAGKSVAYDQEEELAPGQYLSLGKADPAFTFLEVISDSRCPQGVDCIRAGEAVIALEVDGTRREYLIPAAAESDDLPRFPVLGGEVLLLGLDPYPIARVKTTPEAYRLRVIVAERQ